MRILKAFIEICAHLKRESVLEMDFSKKAEPTFCEIILGKVFCALAHIHSYTTGEEKMGLFVMSS